MYLWPAILLPPVVFLTQLTVAYALVPWECENQHSFTIHGLIAISFAVTLAITFHAWHNWRHAGARVPDDKADPASRVRFLAFLGLLVSALTSLIIFAQWIPRVMLSACAQ
jgi:hypothetical protein